MLHLFNISLLIVSTLSESFCNNCSAIVFAYGFITSNDWFTEYFGARNILAEFGVDKNPKILYRAWYQLKKNSHKPNTSLKFLKNG
mgnify:CR=1 FL=1